MTTTSVIGDYTAAITIDGSTHYLLIQPGSSSTAYKKINRNVLLGVTGQPADISTSQTLSNKALDNTNSVTVKDTSFTLQDDSDTTKQAKFQLSGISTATTRTYILPDASVTLADTSSAQTFTNKTLTSPVITGGSIDNTSVSVDTITGHTIAGNGTVYGLDIHSGVLQTSNAVTSNSITNAAVTNSKLQNTDSFNSSWAWTNFTPTWSNLTVGNGTLVYSKYTQIGKTVFFKYSLTLGTTSAIATSPTFTLPVAAASDTSSLTIGDFEYVDLSDGSTFYNGKILWTSNSPSSTASLYAIIASSTYTKLTSMTASIPVAFGAGDTLTLEGHYEAA